MTISKHLFFAITLMLTVLQAYAAGSNKIQLASKISFNSENSHFAKVNGIRLHYIEKGTGPLVILLHGRPETSLA